MSQIPKADCVAVIFQLEDVLVELPLIDSATKAAERRVLLALLGSVAAQPPSPLTLDLLAKCFDSSARLHPTIDVVPLFPFIIKDLSAHMQALGPPAALLSTSKSNDDTIANLLISALTTQLPNLHLSLDSSHQKVPLPLPSSISASPLTHTHARIIGNWDGGPLQFKVVAVGGTFDRLHAGHRLLLAATALVATERIFVGVTSDKLLVNKKNKHLLETYDVREASAVDYMRRVNPFVAVAAGHLTDPKIPPIAATEAGFEAIVVSEETISGAEEINRVRKGLGFDPLVIVVVGLISGAGGGGEKLSSTDLRSLAAGGR